MSCVCNSVSCIDLLLTEKCSSLIVRTSVQQNSVLHTSLQLLLYLSLAYRLRSMVTGYQLRFVCVCVCVCVYVV